MSRKALLNQICSTISELEINVMESQKLETGLRTSFSELLEEKNDLENTLSREKKRNERLLSVMKGVDSSPDSSPRLTHSSRSFCDNERAMLDTVSPVLMQYRYDELFLSHKRCLKQLKEKEMIIKKVQCDKELAHARFENLLSESRKLLKRMELLCCKYLALQARNTNKIYELKELLNYGMSLLLECDLMFKKGFENCNIKEDFIEKLNQYINILKDVAYINNQQ